MTAARNPFTPMLMTFDPAHFYGRENEIISILQMISAQEPNGHAIYGIRAIGKSTLMKYLKAENGALQRYEDYVSIDYRPGGSRRLLFVYASFHNFGEDDQLFLKMLQYLDEELQQDSLAGEVHIALADEDTPRQELAHMLRRALHQLETHQVRVVFLLDDFDMPLNYIDEDDDRLLRNLADDAALIIATEAPISELRPDIGSDSPLIGILRPEAINLMTESAARQLMTEPMQQSNLTLSVLEQDFLAQMAGRQPFLLIAACELYYDMRNEYPDIGEMLKNPDDARSLQAQFLFRMSGLPHVESLLQRTWNKLSREEQRVLYEMARLEIMDMQYPEVNMAARLANKSLAYLDIKQGGYRVFSQIFVDFTTKHYRDDVKRRAQTTTSHHVIEKLSPIDKALLEYFIEHINDVCTFDELLNAVWDDSDKSKRALEAAVFRLRKHLGEGEQIKNVYGKGYKFTSGATP